MRGSPPSTPNHEAGTVSPASPDEADRAPSPARRRWPWWVLRAVLIALIVPGAILAAAELASPSVADAPAEVAALDRAHGSEPITVDPSWDVAQAIVAAEDASFYSNHGVDIPGLIRALWGKLTGADLGGSTISEQLAKTVYDNGRSGLLDRVSEVALALKLRGHYTSPAVLSMYLDAIYYGNGYYGLLAASLGYFGVAPSRLSWAQAALLAGLPQGPTLLDPFRHLGLARQRQGYVLGRLVATGVLTEAQADSAARAPLGLREKAWAST